jgi:hypothetical protein
MYTKKQFTCTNTPSLMVGTYHSGEWGEIKLKFLTNKNTLINYGENNL